MMKMEIMLMTVVLIQPKVRSKMVTWYDFNILEDLNNNTTKSRYLSNQVSLKLEFKIIEGLMLSSMGTFANSNNHSMQELVPGSFASKYNSWLGGIYSEEEIPDAMNNGMMKESTSRSQQWTIRNQLEFAVDSQTEIIILMLIWSRKFLQQKDTVFQA